MKKQHLIKMLHKPVHPVVATIVIIGVVLLIGASLFIMRSLSRLDFSLTTPSKITSVHVTPIPNITAVSNIPIATLSPSFAPTSTLAPGQKAIYTFYVQTTSHTASGKGLELKQTDTGKVFTVAIGTFLVINFGRVGKFHVALSSPQDIFNCRGSECLPHSSPMNALSSFWVSHPGYGTITVIETEEETDTVTKSP